MEPVSLVNCERVTLRGLILDYKSKPFSEGTITEISNGSYDVRFRDEFSLTTSASMHRLTLDGPLPKDTGKDYLNNTTRSPRVELSRCTMHSHLARSVLIKSREALSEDCTFDQFTGTAIHVGAELDWKESGPCRNLVVRRNRFIRNGCGAGAVAVQLKTPKHDVPGIHGALLIEDNVIEGENAHRGIYVTSADTDTIRNNTITCCQ
jgi:hypothetical protein